MGNEDIISILCGTSPDRNKSTSLKDLVERTPVNYKVFDHRKSSTSPGLNRNRSSVLEMTHEKLTCSHMVIRAMSPSIHIQGTCTADTFTAVMVESYWISAFTDYFLIENIQHLKE
jgi:hypothetical protein